MANEQNLIPGVHKLTTEEQSLGGKKSGEAKRLKKAVKKVLEGNVPESMDDLHHLLEEAGVPHTNDYGIAFAMVIKALGGDKPAADWVRDTAGEKPKDEIEHSGGVVILTGDDDIAD